MQMHPPYYSSRRQAGSRDLSARSPSLPSPEKARAPGRISRGLLAIRYVFPAPGYREAATFNG
jgi:hypothetical protein